MCGPPKEKFLIIYLLGGPGSFADIRFDTEYGIIPSFHYVDTFYPTCWLDIPLELASIGCRQVGSGMALWTHRVDLEFGLEIPGPYLYATNLSCLGTESHISHCTADAVGLQTECSDGVLGISCEPCELINTISSSIETPVNTIRPTGGSRKWN